MTDGLCILERHARNAWNAANSHPYADADYLACKMALEAVRRARMRAWSPEFIVRAIKDAQAGMSIGYAYTGMPHPDALLARMRKVSASRVRT